MPDLGLYRALAGGAGLAGCIALLADQAPAAETAFAHAAPAIITVRSAAVAPIMAGPLPGNRATHTPVRGRAPDFAR